MPFDDSQFGYYFGAHGHVDNDADPIGGAIDTGAPHDDGIEDEAIYRPVIGTSDKEYRAIAYRKNEWSGSLVGMRFALRTGGIPPSGSGVITARSTSSSDNGKLWIAYKHASNWVPAGEEVQLAGVSPVTGLVTFDAGTDWVAIYEPGIPSGDIYLAVNGETIGVIYGGGGGNFIASTLYQLALATATNTDLEADNRLSDPADIGSWSRATRWAGADSSVAIPGGDLGPGNYIGYAVRMLIPSGLPKPFGAVLDCDVCPLFDPVE